MKRAVRLCRRTKRAAVGRKGQLGSTGVRVPCAPSARPQVVLLMLRVQKRLGKKSPLCSGVLLVNGLSGGWRWGVYGALCPGGRVNLRVERDALRVYRPGRC